MWHVSLCIERPKSYRHFETSDHQPFSPQTSRKDFFCGSDPVPCVVLKSTTHILSRLRVSRVLKTLPFDRSILRVSEILIQRRASFPVSTTRMGLAISDLCLLYFVQLYDLDHSMVVDLICLRDLYHLKLIFLARLIRVHIEPIQVLHLVLVIASCEQLLGWLTKGSGR
jgi:hypothetical protein